MSRPRQYSNPEQMQEIIDEYFDTEPKPTVTGLALALDLTRLGLINYEGREEFVYTVKRAKARVEQVIEKRLMYENGAAGPIFNLKNNFGWKDEKQLNQNVSGGLKVWNVVGVGTTESSS